MNKKSVFFASFPLLLASLSSCSSHYQLTGVERTRIVVDKRFDAQPDAKVNKRIFAIIRMVFV